MRTNADHIVALTTGSQALRRRVFPRPSVLSLLLVAAAGVLPAACDDPVTGPRSSIATPAAAANDVELPPIFIEALTGRHQFTDAVAVQVRSMPLGRASDVVNVNDASNLAVLRITVQPGARFPWHTHPGPVLVAVTQGEMTYMYADDCVRRDYPRTAFVDPGFGNVHTAYNPSTTQEAVLIATFLAAPAAGALTLPVAAEMQTELDAKCGASSPAAALIP